MKKKIKNITIVWENLEFGGMNSFIENLVNSKKFNNTNIFLITNKNNKGITSLKNNIKNKNLKLITYTSLNSLNLKPFDQSNFIGKFIKLFFILISPFLFLISILQFFFILKKNRTDLVLAACGGYGNFRSDSASLISAKILGYPKRILTIHHCYARVRLWEFFTKIIDIFVSKSSTSIIFGSKAVKKDIEKKTSLLKNIKISKIIHHGVIPLKTKNDNSLKKIFNVKSKNVLKIGMLSRVEKNKGHYDFIDAFYLLPKLSKDRFRIFFIGPIDNNEFKKIKNRLKNLSLENYFKITGFIKSKSLNILINLDLLVSLTKSFEGFGLSIAEALMAKKPVLVTKVGAVTEFLNKHNSSLINANNKNEIKQSLEHFLKNKKEWDSKALEGHKHIMKNFTAEITAEKYFKHINSNIS